MKRPAVRPALPETASRRPLRVALVVVALALAATAEERAFGLFTDGRTMTRTAFAIADLREIGIARSNRIEIRRKEGDAVTRYGIGPSLARAVPMLVAEPVDRAFGVGASQSLFVAEQIAFLLAAALLTGLLVETWGGEARDAARAALACGLASPLAAYAGSDFSEPLQAALVAAAFLFAIRASSREGPWDALAAGASASLALLTKSFLVVLLPCVLLVLFLAGDRERRLRRVLLGAAGFAPVAALWYAFEIVRFGRPFAGYAGERFSNPPLDGLWRLTVGPNKGLFLYFPLALLAIPGFVLLARRSRPLALAVAAFLAVVLGSTAAWWSWDGTAGWGPRLLLPGIPLVAALAVLGARSPRVPRFVFPALLIAGVLVNALGVLVPDVLTTWYYTILPRRALSAAEAARYPDFAYVKEDGVPHLFQIHDVARHAALSPIRVDAWLLKVKWLAKDPDTELRRPPWDVEVPGFEVAVKPADIVPKNVLAFATSRRWPHLFMSFSRREGDGGAFAFQDALQGQVIRAQELRRYDRAVSLAERNYRLVPTTTSAAMLLESYRLAKRFDRIVAWVPTLPPRETAGIEFGLALALYARDAGDEPLARQIAGKAAKLAPGTIYAKLSQIPTSQWPERMRDLSPAEAAQ